MQATTEGAQKMATEPDTGGWLSFGGIAVAMAAMISGWALRGLTWAAAGGKSDGEMSAWRKSVDKTLDSIPIQLQALEAKFDLKLQALETRNRDMDHFMRDAAPRAEMNEGFRGLREESRESFGEIKDQLRELSNFVHGRSAMK